MNLYELIGLINRLNENPEQNKELINFYENQLILLNIEIDRIIDEKLKNI